MKRCNKCQVDFADSVTICRQCGDALVEVSQRVDGVVHCTECGALAKAAWRFCKRCGAKMEDIEGMAGSASGSSPRHPWEPPRIEARNAPEERRCPRCQTALSVEAQYCDVCGAGLREANSRPLGEPTAPVLREQEPRPTELVPVAASGHLDLTLGGYAEERQLTEAEGLSPGERRTVRRAVIGALVLVVIIILVVAVRFWWFRPHAAQRADQPVPAAASPEKRKETPALFPAEFTMEAIEKEDRFAGGHAHAIVKLDDQALFIIRDEGEYASATDRAKAVIENLLKAIANLQLDRASEFRVVNRAEAPTIIQIMPNLKDEKELPIASITNHDVKGYIRRSHGTVTAAQLAEWWLNRLKDRVNLFVKGEAPRLTVTDEDGRLLADLYDRAQKGSPGGRPTRDALYQEVRKLSEEERRLLSYEGVRAFPELTGHHSR